ncbi:hypothetical protein E2C01_097160 [Portunus trituberculatus]|uniref:Uncharacterized protein n=1 Tax=Portunus trituberculatus TaxID=210409 RepID=A0A5B7K4Z9_PORTR|nr:hypothetical protein [Portunus trituberculatus]
MGPPLLETHRTSTSVSLMTGIVNKTYPGVPRVQFPVCDVRDVARAHVKVRNVLSKHWSTLQNTPETSKTPINTT